MIHAFGAVHKLINLSTSASAICADVACLSGTATKYFISISFHRSCIVSIYEYLRLSGAVPRYPLISYRMWCPISVRTMGCRVFVRISFFNWQFRHSCIDFCISYFIPIIFISNFRPEIVMTDSFVSLCYAFMVSYS